jgi:Ca2+:H+ antiporter
MGQFLSSIPKLSFLSLLVIPTLWMQHQHVGEGIPLFLVAALGILGTVTLMGKATENLSVYAGPLLGGVLNATFGNITELIIAVTALQNVKMHSVVRSSITGSILGNLLLVLGAAMFYGGLKHPTQTFTRTGASVNIGMLWVCVICLLVPTFVSLAYTLDPKLNQHAASTMTDEISLVAAFVLLSIYFLSLIFSLRTHRFLLMPSNSEEHEQAEWSKKRALITLIGATFVVGTLSDAFVEALNHMLHVQNVNISEMFVGVIIVAVVGNASEGSVAIWVARRNKMELSYQIAMGSCLQVALMVAPALVLISHAIGKPMSLAFNPFEMISLVAATLIASASLQDGETNWLEGAMFLAVYIFFALVFWYHP